MTVLPSDIFDDEGDTPPLTVTHTAPLWRWKSANSDAPAAWFFVTISGAAGESIANWTGVRGGFASVKVEVRVGATVWRTSVFPSKELGGFMLPMKAAVRKAERFAEGDPVSVELTLIPAVRR